LYFSRSRAYFSGPVASFGQEEEVLDEHGGGEVEDGGAGGGESAFGSVLGEEVGDWPA